METNTGKEVATVQIANRMLLAVVVVLVAVLISGWKASDPDVVRAKRFEVIDDSGKVWGTLEKGKLQLCNSVGTVKATLTSDENNGNLTLSGAEKKRLSVFMADEMPLLAVYDSKGQLIATVPAVSK